MSTNSPDSGRLDQSALAVTWNSTTRPAPRGAAVTSGVPSASSAQFRSASWAEGSASTWRDTVTSSGISRPVNGDAAGKRASGAGWLHDSAPPNCRSPASKRTGNSGSWEDGSPLASAIRGPAKRTSSPPPSTQRSSAAASAPSSGRSASTSTDSSRDKSAARLPSRSSEVGAKARRT